MPHRLATTATITREAKDEEEVKRRRRIKSIYGPELAGLVQKAILKSCESAHRERLVAQTWQENDDVILAHVMNISRERARTEEAGWLFMNFERQRIDLNVQRLVTSPRTMKLLNVDGCHLRLSRPGKHHPHQQP
jgi:hypothetical protein